MTNHVINESLQVSFYGVRMSHGHVMIIIIKSSQLYKTDLENTLQLI